MQIPGGLSPNPPGHGGGISNSGPLTLVESAVTTLATQLNSSSTTNTGAATTTRLQQVCNALRPAKVQAFFDRWVQRLRWPLRPADRGAGYLPQDSY
jgi:hypothetical protein